MSLPAKPECAVDAEYKREGAFPLRLRLMRLLGRQRWIDRGCDAVLRKLYDPDAGKHYKFEVEFFGRRYRGDLANYIDWVVFCYGGAPLNELSLMRDLAAEIRKHRSAPITGYDVGANVGHHTLFMSGIVDGVVSFEPFEGVRVQMEEKIALNKLNNVRVVPVALGLHDEDLTYYPGPGINSGSGTFVAESASQDRVSHLLPVRNGDKLFAEENLPRMDILKVDVEGFEANVFGGLRERIQRDRPVVLTEVLDSTRSRMGGEAFFRACFYEGAVFAGVRGRLNSEKFILTPFAYESAEEVVVVPPEMGGFIASHVKTSAT